MAQLGDFVRAKELLRNAARAFGRKKPWPRKVRLAEAEIALASRDLGCHETLEAARATLEAHGDRLTRRMRDT